MDSLHDDVVVIWLDDTVGLSTENQWFKVTGELRRRVNHVEIFTDITNCIQYIGAAGIERVFLIVTGTYGDDFDAKLFEGIIDDVSIYVLTSNKLDYKDTHTSIRGYFDDTNTLLDQLHEDYMICALDTASGINSIKMNTNECTTRCINPRMIQRQCLQLMFDILRRMPCPLEQSKNRFVNFCRSQYRNRPHELKMMDEFEETYRSEDAITWYIRDSFLYRLLNKGFRTSNLDVIMDSSFVTIDICDQLHDLRSREYVKATSSVVVYRGKVIPYSEFQKYKLNIGKFISYNAFTSTTKNLNIALVFCSAETVLDHLISVIFEISVGSNSSTSTPFAEVSPLSWIPDDKEVLFANDAIFRVDSCEPLLENIWKIKLTFCDNSYSIVENSSDYFDIAMLQLFEILPKISPRTNKANDQMLQWCRRYCKDDPNEVAKIDQFEKSYCSDSAIRWYSKDSFLYRLLNMALRQENIDMIVDFRYFIIDLHQQLTNSHLDYVRSCKGQNLTVYRGQKINLGELRMLKHRIGKYISIRSLFSASLSSEVALLYAELDESDRKQFLQSILFQIEIDLSRPAKFGKDQIFANIMNLSHFIHEEEVLFMANTRFRIHSVTNWNGELWIIRLILLSIDDENSEEMKIMDQHLSFVSNLLIQKYGDSVWSFFRK